MARDGYEGASKKNENDVAWYVQSFEEAESTTYDARKLSERDRDYYDNKQLTAAELATLAERGQPAIIINRIKRKIDFLLGVETMQRADPKAFPRNPQDEQSAHAATDAIRFVADLNTYDVIRSASWGNLLIEGIAAVEVGTEAKGEQREVKLRRIPWDRFFYDPHSSEPDFSDARYLGEVLWMDCEDAEARWPKAKEVLEATLGSQSPGETYDDKPKWKVWADRKRKRVRIVQMWHKEGKDWRFCTFTKGGKLESGVSPYTNEDGETTCPVIAASAYVDRENQRYGVVREMIGPQDEINKRRSKALHLMTTRQTFGSRSAIPDVDEAKKQLARPDGHVEIIMGELNKDFGVLPTGDMLKGQFELLVEAKNEIDLMGPNASMQGKGEQDQSGRAIIAQQQGGYNELAPMLDRLRQLNIRVYKAIWDRIRQFWTGERWVRVTDDERNVRFVGLNRPVSAGEMMLKQIAETEGPEAAQMAERQIMMDPRAQEVASVENPIGEMTVDIIVDDAPDSVTIQHEQFQMLVEMVKGGVPIPPDVLIEASQLRNKDQLLEKMSQGQQQPDPKVQAMQMKAEIDARKADADMQRDDQKAQVEIAKIERKAELEETVAVREMERDDARFQMEMAHKEREMDMQQQQHVQTLSHERENALLNLQTMHASGQQKLELAEQAAKQKAKTQQQRPAAR